MPSKKPSPKAKANKKKRKASPIELGDNELRIRFGHPAEVLPQLLVLADHFNEEHTGLLEENVADDVLGGARARIIVSGCARSTAWLTSLGELGLNPAIFRSCVASGVDRAGYVPPEHIPASPDTTLIEVVAAIQGSPRK